MNTPVEVRLRELLKATEDSPTGAVLVPRRELSALLDVVDGAARYLEGESSGRKGYSTMDMLGEALDALEDL